MTESESPSLLLQRAAACTNYEAADWVTDQWWFWLLLLLASFGAACMVGFVLIKVRESR